MEDIIFNNLKGTNLNRRKITILKQTGNVLEANVEFAGEVGSEATPITAEVMNNFQTKINNALTNSNVALEKFNKAEEDFTKVEEKSDKALEISRTAEENSISANTKATNAESLASEALNHVTEKQGSKIFENDELISTFNADKKLNATQGENNANKIMVTDESGKIIPSSILQIGEYKLYSKINNETGKSSLIIELPAEEAIYE